MNDLMSAACTRLWKDTLVGMIGASRAQREFAGPRRRRRHGRRRIPHRRRARAGGDSMSDLSSSAADAAADDEPARVVVCDINPAMLAEGRQRADALPASDARPRLEFVTADARQLPFADCSL